MSCDPSDSGLGLAKSVASKVWLNYQRPVKVLRNVRRLKDPCMGPQRTWTSVGLSEAGLGPLKASLGLSGAPFKASS